MVKIYEFDNIHMVSSESGNGVNAPRNVAAQMPSGAPTHVHDTAGAKTMQAGTKVIKIVGTGSITWPNAVTEDFDGVEFRGVSGAADLTIVA